MGEDEIVNLFHTQTHTLGLSCSIQVQWSMVDKTDHSLAENSHELPSKPDLLSLPALNVAVEAKAFRVMWDALYPLWIATSP